MANTDLISSIEALLAEAKLYNKEKLDRVTRASMLEKVEALHYRLESPEEAMFRQLTNVSPSPGKISSTSTDQMQVFGNLSSENFTPDGCVAQDTS